MSRHLRSVLPITRKQLTPMTIDPRNVSKQLKQNQLSRKQYYDKGSKPLNDPVLMQAGNRWIPATVMQKAKTPHSYIVKTRGGQTYH